MFPFCTATPPETHASLLHRYTSRASVTLSARAPKCKETHPHTHTTITHAPQTICVTKGVVSRIDTQTYNRYSASALLIAQIDAAINPGNSGGPAVDEEGKVAGVAFLKRSSIDTDNVGFIIPAQVARNFLRSLEINQNSNTQWALKRAPFELTGMATKCVHKPTGAGAG